MLKLLADEQRELADTASALSFNTIIEHLFAFINYHIKKIPKQKV
ncbi:hypothetical protein [Bacillus swezeyi]